MAKIKGEAWKVQGIYKTIMLSREQFFLDKSLPFSSLFFWSVLANSILFYFLVGPMNPTIQGVCVLTGLPAYGEEITHRLKLSNSFDHLMVNKGKGP